MAPDKTGSPALATEPLKDCFALTPEHDYARGAFSDGFGDVEGSAIHTRAVAYLRGSFWLVVDKMDTDRPREMQALWHFHPDCTTAFEGDHVASVDEGKGNLRIVPLSNVATWEVEIVKGTGRT